jgi:hypothetical protein
VNIAGSASVGVDLIAGHHQLGRSGAVVAGVDLSSRTRSPRGRSRVVPGREPCSP